MSIGSWVQSPQGAPSKAVIMPFCNLQFTCTEVPTQCPPGTWCSGITSASHAEGPGFKSQCVHAQCQSIPPRNVCDRQRHAAILRLRPCPRALPLAQSPFCGGHQRGCGASCAQGECCKGSTNSRTATRVRGANCKVNHASHCITNGHAGD